MLWSTPISTRLATMEDPPTVTNGNGMPVTGATPIVMPDVHEHLEEEADDEPTCHHDAVEVVAPVITRSPRQTTRR